MYKYLFFCLGFIPLCVYAQDPLTLKISLNCQYTTNSSIPVDLFTLPSLDLVDAMVNEILTKTGKAKNFELVATNVQSVAAVIGSSSSSKKTENIRYLLYSRRFFEESNDLTYQYVILAHAIAHHVLEHTLRPERRLAEEAEADDYIGSMLFFTGRSRTIAEQVPVRYPSIFGEALDTRLTTIVRAYNRAESSLLVEPGAGFANDGSGRVVKGMPEFPFPPPSSSAKFPMEVLFQQCKTLGEINQKLREALDFNGYYEKSYFYIPGGFVLVTRMEQIKKDGYSVGEKDRWKAKPVRDEDFTLASYLRALLTSEPGYFRIFAFAVTNQSFKMAPTGSRIEEKDFQIWVNAGMSSLSGEVARVECLNQKTEVHALIYELTITAAGREGKQSEPSELSGKDHLEKSKILTYLRNKH